MLFIKRYIALQHKVEMSAHQCFGTPYRDFRNTSFRHFFSREPALIRWADVQLHYSICSTIFLCKVSVSISKTDTSLSRPLAPATISM